MSASADRFLSLARVLDASSFEAKARALADFVRAEGAYRRVTVIIFGDQHNAAATAPDGPGFELRGTPELQRVLLGAFAPYAVDGTSVFVLPHGELDALALLSGYEVGRDVVVAPIQSVQNVHGVLILEPDGVLQAADLDALRAFADLAARFLQQEHWVSAIRRQTRLGGLLATISERTHRSFDRREILTSAADDVRRAFDATRSVVYCRDPRDEAMALVLLTAQEGELDTFALSQPIAGTYLEEAFGGSIVPHEHVDESPGDTVLRELGVRSALMIPLSTEGGVEHVMAIHFAEQRTFDEIDIVMTRSVAFHTGLALANVRLYERERSRRTRAEAMEHVGRILRDAQNVDEALLLFTITASHDSRVSCATYALGESTAVRRALRLCRPAETPPPERVDVGSVIRELDAVTVLGSRSMPAHLRELFFRDGDGVLTPLHIDGGLWGFVVFSEANPGVDWSDTDQHLYFRSLVTHLELSLATALAFERVQQLARALGESNEFKDDLLAMLAHDFKGPLTVILGYCDLLTELAGDDVREQVETIYAQTKRLVSLSEDALTLAQTQAGGFALARTTVDLRDVLAGSVEAYNRGGERIALQAPEKPVRASIDPARFAHVLDNLLMNALKYSTEDVTVTLTVEGGAAVIAVADRGIGIPEAEIEGIFARFGRASNARRKGIAGSGVGLYVARKIVEVHGGAIAVTSKENEGTTFTIRLPAGT